MKARTQRTGGGTMSRNAEQEADQSHLGRLLKSIPDLVYRLQPEDGRFLYVSPWSEALLGFSREELRSMGKAGFAQRIHPEDADARDRALAELLNGDEPGRAVEVQYRFTNKSGSRIGLVECCRTARDGDGEPVVLVGALRASRPAERALDLGHLAESEFIYAESSRLLIKGRDLRYAWGNRREAEALGVEVQDLVGKTDRDFYPPETAAEFREVDRRILREPGSIEPASTFYHYSGEGQVWQKAKAPVYDSLGRLVGLLIAQTDVSRQRPAAVLAQETAVMAACEDALIGVALDGTIGSWNAGAERLYGYSLEEVRGRPLSLLAAESSRDELEQKFGRAIHGEPVRGYEAVHRTAGGYPVYVSLAMGPMRAEDGTVTGVSIIARNITERVHAERAFRESSLRFRSVLESFRDVAYKLVLQRGTFSYVSPSVEDMLGYTPAEMVALGTKGVYRLVHPDDLPRFREQTLRLLRGVGTEDRESPIEYRIRHQDGHYVWVGDSRRVVRDGSGRAHTLVGTLRDVTARKRAEGTLRQRAEQARELLLYHRPTVYVKDRDLNFIYANEAFCFSLPVGPKEIAGKTDYDFWPRKVAERSRREDREALEAGQTVVQDDTVKVPVRDETGESVALVCVQLPGEEQKRWEGLVCQWASVAHSSADAVVGLSLEGTILSWNKGAEQIYGYSEEDVTGRAAVELAAPEQREEMERLIRKVAAGETVRGRETTHLSADGEKVEVSLTLSPVPDSRGELVALSAVMRDITEHKRAEQALRDSEERFRRMAESAWDGINICEWDPETRKRRLVYCNDRFVEMSGYSREELMAAEDLSDLTVSHVSADREWEVYERIEGELPVTGVSSWKRPDGKENYYEWSATPVKAGDKYYLYGVDRDITERREAEQKLRESEERFRLLIQTAREGINVCRWNPEERSRQLLFCNERFVEMSGYSREELMAAEDLNELIVDHRTAEELTEGEMSMDVGLSVSGLASWKRPDGEENYYEWSAVRVKRGGEYRLFGVDRDITRRIQTEERLREVLGSARDVAYKINLQENRYEYVSPSVERLFGFTPEEFLEIGLAGEGRRIHPDDLYRVNRDFRAIQAGEPEGRWSPRIEYRWKAKDGSYRWVSNSRRVIRDEGGEPTAIVGTMRDITRQKEAEEERRRVQDQMERAQKLGSLGVLAGGVAHDFNNLLTGVLGNAGLALLDMPPDSPARYSIEKIQEAAERAAELANQMLAYSGKGRLRVEKCGLSGLIEESHHLLEAAVSDRVTLRLELAEDLPRIEGDPSQLKQVVMNLVSNGSEAIGEETGVVTVSTAEEQPEEDYFDDAYLRGKTDAERYVRLTVTDTGCGMDEATRAQVFDPFFTTKFTGRGLGLAAVLGIVRSHEGTIRVNSDPGRGSTFETLFPAGELAQRPDAPRERAVERPVRGRATVMVVDDEEMVVAVASRMLEQAGYTAIRAHSGREAIERLRQETEAVAAVILDVAMPEMSGRETFHQLRRIRPDLPVILSSGYSAEEARRRFEGDEADGFLQKPYSPAKLSVVLAEVLSDR